MFEKAQIEVPGYVLLRMSAWVRARVRHSLHVKQPTSHLYPSSSRLSSKQELHPASNANVPSGFRPGVRRTATEYLWTGLPGKCDDGHADLAFDLGISCSWIFS